MKCSRIQKLLSEYIDGALDAKTLTEVERHLKECPDCRTVGEELASTVKLLRTLPEIKAPEEFSQSVSRLIQRKLLIDETGEMPRSEHRRIIPLTFLRAAAGLAAVLMLMVLVHVYYKVTSPAAAPVTASRMLFETKTIGREAPDKEVLFSAEEFKAKDELALGETPDSNVVILKTENGTMVQRRLKGSAPEDAAGRMVLPQKTPAEALPGAFPENAGKSAAAEIDAKDLHRAAERQESAPSVLTVYDADSLALKRRYEYAQEVTRGLAALEKEKAEGKKIIILKDKTATPSQKLDKGSFLGEEFSIFSQAPQEDYKKILDIIAEMRSIGDKKGAHKGEDASKMPEKEVTGSYQTEEIAGETADMKPRIIELSLTADEYFSLLSKIIDIQTVSTVKAFRKAPAREPISEMFAESSDRDIVSNVGLPASQKFKIILKIFSEGAPSGKENKQ